MAPPSLPKAQIPTRPEAAPAPRPSLPPGPLRPGGMMAGAQTPTSTRSRYSIGPTARDYYPSGATAPLKPSEVVPSSTYIERGQRWMEKEEAYSLRHALHDMDLKDRDEATGEDESAEDSKLYEAALQEAAELVWQYEHGGLPPANAPGPYRYRPHLRQNSYAHARTASAGKYGEEIQVSGLARNCSRSVSGSSTGSDRSVSSAHFAVPKGSRKSSMKRNISGEVEPPFSADQIWEEPETSSIRNTPAVPAGPREPSSRSALEHKGRNPLNRVRFSTGPDDNRGTAPKVVSSIEIHRNPPSRTRDPQYVTNTQSNQNPGHAGHAESEDDVLRKHGVEIRGDDIRQATSMRLFDRSGKLPTPSAVSDNPSRPIVSFDKNWTPAEENSDGKADGPRDGTRPAVPTINVPSISVSDCESAADIPVIVTPDDAANPGSNGARPLPQPSSASRVAGRQRTRPRPTLPPRGTTPRGSALCHECGTSIQGRFIALSGSSEKFHPGCFSCYACGTSLEALEISPEPDSFRNERLDRIQRRAIGEVLDETAGKTMAEDGDERLRFYCHLDWHELFAPRCKHCQTPILGEHIVALGEHWHYGHFFCAECGDPFEKGMTHIEKDGYAWCINCQTKRTERRAPKCKTCKLAVVGQYIQALGGEWHDQCFRCATCNGAFDDGQIFPKEDGSGNTVVLCTGCRARELKQ
jgi:hypothetical protein